jgi:hypothetical protein
MNERLAARVNRLAEFKSGTSIRCVFEMCTDVMCTTAKQKYHGSIVGFIAGYNFRGMNSRS